MNKRCSRLRVDAPTRDMDRGLGTCTGHRREYTVRACCPRRHDPACHKPVRHDLPTPAPSACHGWVCSQSSCSLWLCDGLLATVGSSRSGLFATVRPAGHGPARHGPAHRSPQSCPSRSPEAASIAPALAALHWRVGVLHIGRGLSNMKNQRHHVGLTILPHADVIGGTELMRWPWSQRLPPCSRCTRCLVLHLGC